jgi:quinol monooxygenase YgiN
MRWTLNALPSLMAGKKLLVWRLHASRAKLQALRLQVKSLQGTESDLQQQVRRLQTQHDHVRSIMAMEAETWKLRQMQKSALDLLQVYATETHQLKNKGLKAICRMMKMFLFSSLARWKERVTQDRHARRKTLKVVQRLMKATLVGAYVRWCNNTVNEKQMKTTALKVVQRLMNRTLMEGFERWRDQAAEEKQMKTKTLKVLHRLMNRTLMEGFERWQDQAAEEKQMKTKTLKVVHRVMNRALEEGFERWRNQAAEEKQMKTTALKVVQRLMNRTLVDRFERWRDRFVEEKQMNSKTLKVVHRLMNRTLMEGFERWRDRVAGEKQMKTTALKMVFERWREHICEHKWRQKISARKQKISALRWLHISEFCRSPILRNVFQDWLRLIQERHAKLRALHRLSQAWDLFLSSVGRARNMRKVAYSLHIRTTSRQLRCAFEVWVCCGFFVSSYVATV